MTEITHFIAGRNAPGHSGRSSPVYDPATGARTALVALADATRVDSHSVRQPLGVIAPSRTDP